jgi:F-type H+-transporting ATPase subunit a
MSAKGEQVIVVNWYQTFLEGVTDSHFAAFWWPVLGSVTVVGLLIIVGLASGLWKMNPEKMTDEELLPPSRFGVRAFVEILWSVVSSTLTTVVGEKYWSRFAPLLGGTFFFIILCNLSGVVPGFTPATEQMNLTFAMGIIIFLSFNYIGLKYAGLNYLKHLLGPVWILAPLMLVIEVIGTCARPLSLGLRLFGNISGDHLVFSVFSTLQKGIGVPWFPLPVVLLVFGLMVACLQAFIFMTLSAVYVKLALDTAHHHEEHH